MYRFKKIMVGLNLSNLDKTTLPYAAMISRLTKSEKVYFIHAARRTTIPESILEEHPLLSESDEEATAYKITESVKSLFDGYPETDKAFEVVAGQPLDEMLRRVPKKEIDLILVGRKKNVRRTRLLPLNLARNAPCSVMVIPNGVEPKISRLLLPVDFSEYSADALEVALSIAIAKDIPEILCLHVYQLPLGYYKTGKSTAEFTEIMRQNAQADYQNFVKNIDTKGISLIPHFVKDKNPANAIRKTINQHKIDLVVMGARGRSPIAALLIGSVTEHIIQVTDIPVIAVKQKGANLKFLEAVFQM